VLQLSIWEFALTFQVSQPKNVYVEVTSVPDKHRPRHIRLEFNLCTPVPSLLHVSQITRYESLKVYRPVFNFNIKSEAGSNDLKGTNLHQFGRRHAGAFVLGWREYHKHFIPQP
jgi:hypothetical protein